MRLLLVRSIRAIGSVPRSGSIQPFAYPFAIMFAVTVRGPSLPPAAITTSFPLQLTGAYRLEGTTLANRLAATHNYGDFIGEQQFDISKLKTQTSGHSPPIHPSTAKGLSVRQQSPSAS